MITVMEKAEFWNAWKVVETGLLIRTEADYNSAIEVLNKLLDEVGDNESHPLYNFLESRLKDCEFVIVKTYKDRTDRFDRYLADIFYAPGVADGTRVVQEGIYLNQELLNERLAVVYEDGE